MKEKVLLVDVRKKNTGQEQPQAQELSLHLASPAFLPYRDNFSSAQGSEPVLCPLGLADSK